MCQNTVVEILAITHSCKGEPSRLHESGQVCMARTDGLLPHVHNGSALDESDIASISTRVFYHI